MSSQVVEFVISPTPDTRRVSWSSHASSARANSRPRSPDHVLGAPARLAGVSLVTRDAGRYFTNLGYTPLVLLSLLTVLAKLLEPCPERLEQLLERCQVLG